jgi:hypothetical protein
MSALAERIAALTFDGHDVGGLPYHAIRDTLARHTLVRVRGLVDRDAIRAAHARIAAAFDAANDRRHDPRDTDAVRRNFQKLQVGANSGVGTRRRHRRL